MAFNDSARGSGQFTATIAAASSAAAVKASAGRLCRILVTTTGTAALTFYDNAAAASGTVIGVVPANAAVGTLYDLEMPALSGIYCSGGASTPAVTVSFA